MAHYDDDETQAVSTAREALASKSAKAEAEFNRSVWRQRAKFIREATVKERANLQRELRRSARQSHG